MFTRPILFYSEYCIHSKNFINTLIKHNDLYEDFIRINIDVDPATKTRPKIFYDIQRELNISIKEVPTVITPGPEHILTGADAFDWLEFQLNSLNNNSEKSIEGFNSMEMGSFSDSYSTFGSSDLYDAKEQTFKFIGKNDDRIETPPETSSVSKDDYSRKQQERDMFDTTYARGGGQVKIPPRSNSREQFGNVSDKQKDIDKRLQQLIAERESFGQGIQRK